MADQDIDIQGLQQALDQLQEKFGISDRTLSSFVKSIQKSSSDFQKELGKLNKEVAKGTKGYQDQVAMLNKLDAAIEELTDSMEGEQDSTKKLAAEQNKAALLAQRDSLQTSASIRGLGEATAKAASGMTLAAVKGAGDFVKGLQSGSSGFELAAGLMNAGIDVATSGLQGLGKGAQAVAPMLMRFGPWGMAAGVALEFLGIAADKGADTLNKLAKFGVEILLKEVDKTVKAFHSMNASGAMFANGMQGMRDASKGANLTVEQFAKVIKDNSEAIGQSGLGMTEGAIQIGRVTKTFSTFDKTGKVVSNSLLNLGYGFEEQAGLVAETIANMRRGAGGKATDQEVAEQTKKYAESLRLIASITGEDAKTKVAAAAQAANELIFQQKLAGKSKEQRAAITAAMATMTDQERKNFMDRVALGEVVNKEGAIYEATIGGAREKGEAALRLFDQNNLTAESNADLNAKYSDQLRKNVLAQESIGMAGRVVGGTYADVAKSMADTLHASNQYSKDSVAAGKKNLKDAENTKDPLTKSLMNAEIAAQQLKLTMQEMMDVPIKKFAQVTKAMLEGLEKTIRDVFGGSGNKEVDAAAERVLDAKKARQEELEQLKKSDPKKYKQEAAKDEKKRTEGMKSGDEKYQQMINDAGPALYAEGGTIPAGETGIVGEAGPEFVKGPAEVTSAKDTKEILSKLGNTSVGQLTSQAMDKMSYLTSESDGSIAGYFLAAAKALKNDNGIWTLGGEVIDKGSAQQILDFVQGWPKLKQEIQGELDKAKDLIGEGGGKLDATISQLGVSTKASDLATGFAKGGIASGSLSGYSATLHGTEAVVPLPDNKSIPVSLDGSALSGALQAQSDILSNILSAMQQNNKYASGILQASV
jgi:hypothetical protein